MSRLLIIAASLLVFAGPIRASEPDVPPPFQMAQADEVAASAACINAPTRRCVADMALRAAAEYPDPTWRSMLFQNVAQTYVKLDSLEPVLAAMTESGSPKEQVRSIASLGRSLAKDDIALARTALSRAMEIAKSMDDGVPRLASYATIAGYAVDAGDTQTIRSVLEEVRTFSGMPPEMFVQFEFVRALAAIGDIDGAMDAVDAVGSDVDRLDAILQVVHFTKEQRIVSQARRLTADAMTEAKAIESNEFHQESIGQSCAATYGQRDAALIRVSHAQTDFGDFKAASATANEIEDAYVRAIALKDVAIALIKAGRQEEARRVGEGVVAVSQQMDVGDCRMAAIDELVRAQSEAGDYRGALKLLEASGNTDKPHLFALSLVADAWVRSGDGAPAEGEVAAVLRAMVLVRTAAQQASADNIGAARAAIAAAQSTAAAVTDSEQRKAVLIRIAANQAELGDGAAVEATMKQVAVLSIEPDDPGLEPLMSSLRAKVQLKSGHPRQAVAMANQIEEPWTRADTLLQIANALPN